jgi:transcriptional regulator with XRE-family HTH domain
MISAARTAVDYAGGNGGAPASHYDAPMNTATHSVGRAAPQPFGDCLRHWRQHRRLSQLDLAQEAEISTRHLSFVETGRSVPSREMVLRLAERLEVPLRERNTLLVAAGYAPMYRERRLDDPAFAPAKQAVELILKSHEPYPAFAVDRHWNLVAANRMVPVMLAGADPSLLQGQVNVLRLSLHPQGVAPRIANLAQWRNHIFERLRQQIQATGDNVLTALLEELRSYPVPDGAAEHIEGEHLGVVMPFKYRTEQGILNLISTTTIFGTPVDVTLQELAMETFFPADETTAQALRRMMSPG